MNESRSSLSSIAGSNSCELDGLFIGFACCLQVVVAS